MFWCFFSSIQGPCTNSAVLRWVHPTLCKKYYKYCAFYDCATVATHCTFILHAFKAQTVNGFIESSFVLKSIVSKTSYWFILNCLYTFMCLLQPVFLSSFALLVKYYTM